VLGVRTNVPALFLPAHAHVRMMTYSFVLGRKSPGTVKLSCPRGLQAICRLV